MSGECQMCDGFGDAPGAGLLPESDCPECDGTGRDCGYRPNPRLCEICGRGAMALGSDARCAEHDNERSE